MKGRKALYDFSHLQVGDKIEVKEPNLAKYAYQTIYNRNRKNPDVKLKAYRENGLTFIMRIK